MDVRGWLEGTADRAPPDPSDVDEARLPAFLNAPSKPGLAHPTAREYHRKRKREASDSSIIALQPVRQQPRVHNEAATHGTHVKPLGRRRATAIEHASKSASECEYLGSSKDGSVAEAESLPKKTYTKRQRHKTKADRYEPKAREEHKERDHHHKHPKTKRRKSRRNGDGEHTAGLVQSFQLKNGPKNNRLTLKADLNAGMFRHGRASAQMPGKRNGLPDLVFNEMKFLQKPESHQDDHEGKPSKRKHSTKEKKRELEEGEISNYFATQSQRCREGPKQTLQGAITRRRKTFPISTANEKPVAAYPSGQLDDLPEVPYLGFGKRGPLHRSSQPPPQKTSYFSSSGSTAHQTSQKLDHNSHAQRSQQPPKSKSKPEQPLTEHERTPENTIPHVAKPSNQETGQASGGQRIPSQRTRGPAMIEKYQAEATKVTTQDTQPPSRTSQSLPKMPSRRASTCQPRADPKDSRNRAEAAEYHTSDILKVHDRTQKLVAIPSAARDSSVLPSDKDNQAPESSSPTSKLLKKAQTATKQSAALADRESTRTPQQTKQADEIDLGVATTISRHKNNLYAQEREIDAFAAQQVRRLISERDLHSLHRVSEQFWHPPPAPNPHFRLPPGDSGRFDIWKNHGEFRQDEYAEEEEEEVLDNRPNEWHRSNEMSIGRDFEQPYIFLAQNLPSEPQSQQFEVGGTTVMHRNAGSLLGGILASRTASGRGSSVFVEVTGGVAMNGGQELGDTQLEDFWRPNRLY